MNDVDGTQRAATWDPPGPGTWIADRSHGPPNPTPLFRRMASEGTAPAYRDAMRETGAPIDTIDIQFVHGQMYRRVVPLIGARFDRGKPPPAPLLKLITRIHPAFRREERQAAFTVEHRPYLEAIAGWYTTERDQWIADNHELQAVDPSGLDDNDLAGHLDDLDSLLRRGWYRHHRLHSYDLGPIGDLLAHTNDWGFDRVQVMELLRGSSPATTEAADHARRIADALREAGIDPASIAEVDTIRGVPAASDALDAYLDTYGWRLVSGYDIVGAVLNELPNAICGVVRAAARPVADQRNDDAEAALRDRCPEPELFDQLLADARAAYGVRDDNGPLTSQWPTGLTRRACLEAGRRLAETDRLRDAAHVFDLDLPELAALLRNDTGPGADAVADRAAHREWEGTLRGPDFLGAPPVEPDMTPLPPSLQRMMKIVTTAVELLEPDTDRNAGALEGLGIGSETYTGTACVVDNAVDAIDRLEPGDVLVTPFTSPSFNAILPIAGAVVVQEGGLLCHAAVMARELELPAVIGCLDALEHIADGDRVEVDPGAGRVRVLAVVRLCSLRSQTSSTVDSSTVLAGDGGPSSCVASMERPTDFRIDPITDPDDDLAEILAGTLVRNGTPLNIFGVLGHHPDLLKRFNRFGGWMLNRGVVPLREKEIVILRIGWNAQSVYEFGQHTLLGRERGLTDQEIWALTESPDAHDWSAQDRDLIALADDLSADDCVSEPTWQRLAQRWDPDALIELIVLAGVYRLVSGFLNSTGVQLDDGVPSWPEQPA